LLLVALVATALAVSVKPAALAQPGAGNVSGSELKNVAVVAGAPWDKLIADISYMGSLGGKPEAGAMIEGGFSFFTQGKGPTAIDKTKAWGVIVQTDGIAFFPVACVPVVKPEILFDVAKGYGAEVKEGEGGITEVALPQRTIYVKLEGGMAFISNSIASLARLPREPQQVLTSIVGEYDLAARISVQNVPEMYRQFAVKALQDGVKQGLKRKDDESDEDYAAREKSAEAQMKQVERWIGDVENVKLAFGVDSKQKRTFADASYAFKAGTELAKQTASYSEPKTNFAGFYQPGAAATLQYAMQADPKAVATEMAQVEASLRSVKEQISTDLGKKVDDPEVREALQGAFDDWLEALADTFKTGHLDAAASLSLAADSLTFVSGARVTDTAKVESGFKKLEQASKKDPNFPGIKWNAVSHAGVTFHTITIPVPESKGPRQILGEKLDVAIGLGPEAAYVAIGKDNLEAVKKAIDASAASKGKAVLPVDVSIKLGPFLEVAASQADEGPAKAMVKKIADSLSKDGNAQDHLRLTAKLIPNGMQYHFEAEEGALKAIGAAATIAQQRRMQLPE
jgi:hypothetical protein